MDARQSHGNINMKGPLNVIPKVTSSTRGAVVVDRSPGDAPFDMGFRSAQVPMAIMMGEVDVTSSAWERLEFSIETTQDPKCAPSSRPAAVTRWNCRTSLHLSYATRRSSLRPFPTKTTVHQYLGLAFCVIAAAFDLPHLYSVPANLCPLLAITNSQLAFQMPSSNLT